MIDGIDGEDPELQTRLRAYGDAIRVPAAPLRRRHGGPNRLLALASVATVIVAAVLVGRGLGQWRANAPIGATAPTATGAGVPAPGALQPDARYGWLATTGGSGDVALFDELGRQLGPSLGPIARAAASPDGRFVALWYEPATPGIATLRFFDALTQTAGPVLFQTNERLAGGKDGGVAWADDSSAVVIATVTKPPRYPAGSSFSVTIRTIERSGASNRVGTVAATAADPLGWNRVANRIAVQVGLPGRTEYWLIEPSGPPSQALTVDDTPIAADGARRYVVSFRSCAGCNPSFVVHDLLTYAKVAEIPLASAGGSGGWGVWFRPQSADLIVRTQTGDRTALTFTLDLYPDAGRGAKRALESLRIENPAGVAEGPLLQERADGSALFSGVRNGDGTWTGTLIDLRPGVDLRTGGRTPLVARPVVAQALASVLLEPAPAPSGIAGTLTRQVVLERIRGLSGLHPSISRIAAKLVDRNTLRSARPDLAKGTIPGALAWVVAVSGDVRCSFCLVDPPQPFRSALYLIDARTGDVFASAAGPDPWPAGFDALPDESLAANSLAVIARVIAVRLPDVVVVAVDAAAGRHGPGSRLELRADDNTAYSWSAGPTGGDAFSLQELVAQGHLGAGAQVQVTFADTLAPDGSYVLESVMTNPLSR